MPGTPTPVDPYGAFNFLVEIDGVTKAGFAECRGLSGEASVIEYREGGDANTVRKLPGLIRYPSITLVRGLTQDKNLWNWWTQTVNGQPARTNGTITLLDRARNAVAQWSFRNGWPSKWEGPPLNAKGNDIAIETLEITHEGIDWK
ncbi:MAG TPA: phage tail protein [Candidatus Binataceae bacterium]